jgi:UTP--glucose-1-phosphate uridylyltransferase
VSANEVEGVVEPPWPGDVEPLPDSPELLEVGETALAAGTAGLVVLAGGMATRMGGVVKALVEVVDGLRFLDLRLMEMMALERRYGRRPPLFLMTSSATDGPIRAALQGSGPDVHVFRQGEAQRLTPDGDIFLGADGKPSAYARGHGDLVDALVESGMLDRFMGAGGETLMLANLDNLGATLDPLLVGFHRAHGLPLTAEVVDLGADKGGVPVRWNGRAVILEDFRLPPDFDRSSVGVFNTNTFHVDAGALASHDAEWTWFRVEKEVDGRTAIQLERLLGELTSHLETRFVRVPRDGEGSRFLPAKDFAELDARRPEIVGALEARGIL